MRTPVAVWMILLVGSLSQAEDVSPRAKQPSTPVRLRGAVTVSPTPDGLLSLGGPVLRYLPWGAKSWQALHKVEGDRLYRVNADDTGRVLAAWSKEPVFHLFHLKTKQHLTFPKPAFPQAWAGPKPQEASPPRGRVLRAAPGRSVSLGAWEFQRVPAAGRLGVSSRFHSTPGAPVCTRPSPAPCCPRCCSPWLPAEHRLA